MAIAIFVAVVFLAIALISAFRGRTYITAYKQFLKKDFVAQKRESEAAEKRLTWMGKLDIDLAFVSFFAVLAVFFGIVGLPVTACLCIFVATDGGAEVIRKLLTQRVANHFKVAEDVVFA